MTNPLTFVTYIALKLVQERAKKLQTELSYTCWWRSSARSHRNCSSPCGWKSSSQCTLRTRSCHLAPDLEKKRNYIALCSAQGCMPGKCLPAAAQWSGEHPLVSRMQELEHDWKNGVVTRSLVVLPQREHDEVLGPVTVSILDVVISQPAIGCLMCHDVCYVLLDLQCSEKSKIKEFARRTPPH